jgi:hypothetical protein
VLTTEVTLNATKRSASKNGTPTSRQTATVVMSVTPASKPSSART